MCFRDFSEIFQRFFNSLKFFKILYNSIISTNFVLLITHRSKRLSIWLLMLSMLVFIMIWALVAVLTSALLERMVHPTSCTNTASKTRWKSTESNINVPLLLTFPEEPPVCYFVIYWINCSGYFRNYYSCRELILTINNANFVCFGEAKCWSIEKSSWF